MAKKSRITYEIKDWILWISLSIIIATVLGSTASVLLRTGTPFMAVMSNSMLHSYSSEEHFWMWMKNEGWEKDELESMPFSKGFARGDIIVVRGKENYEVGDVIIYHTQSQGMPIVHRLIEIENGEYRTKGDNNPIIDPWIVEKKNVEGEVVFVIPYLGFIKVIPMEALAWVFG